MSYNFKPGYRYLINVTSAQSTSTSGYPDGAYLRADRTNSAGGSSTCTGPAILIPDFSGNPPAVQYTSTTFDIAPLPFSNVTTSSLSTIEFTAMPHNLSTARDLTIYISKIEIIETLYPPEFSIQSSVSSLTCGTTPSVTFTVNNLTYTPGVTSWVWSLGPTPNGWTVGGSAAPATKTTSTNQLILGTSCGVTPKPVSVSVITSSGNYTTNTLTLPVTQPSYSISGSATLCTSTGTYQVNGLPCGATVSWTSSPSGIITHPTSGNSITVTKSGNGQVLLTANITACGATTSKNYSIYVGLP